MRKWGRPIFADVAAAANSWRRLHRSRPRRSGFRGMRRVSSQSLPLFCRDRHTRENGAAPFRVGGMLPCRYCTVASVEWSWPAYGLSAVAVIVSGALAWAEGNWRKRPGLAMGFADHGGMWSDLVLLSMANAVIAPHLSVGWWRAAALLASTVPALAVHAYWYSPRGGGDHMWPAHVHGVWWRDLSWAGWAHVVYVMGELTLLAGFAIHPVPSDVAIFVAAIFTIHVPIGLLQPRWFLTGHIATVQEQPLLAPLLLALWAVTGVKIGG